MTTTFLVSSAICTKFGIYTREQRVLQTIQTLKSIREKVPGTTIYLIESSGQESINTTEVEQLSEYADAIFDYSRDSVIKQLHETIDIADIVKNFTEMWAFQQAFVRILKNENNTTPLPERMFKISGRYLLDNSFDISRHTNENYIFAKRRPSQFPIAITGGATEQYMSRLWSWPGNKLEYVQKMYSNMLGEFIKANNNKQYLDIEHLLFMHFGHLQETVEVDRIGITGAIAPNGAVVAD